MSSAQSPEHQTRSEFSAQLSTLEGEIRELFTRVILAVERATDALVSGDRTEATRMTQRTTQARSILGKVERQIDLTFARQAPVAADLRFMITALRVVPELERCMELARHVAERARLADQLPADVLASFAHMGRMTTAMWEKASGAWRDRDPNAGIALDQDDDELDLLCNELTVRLGQMEDHPTVAMEGRLVIRFYERLGDHAVHVSRRTAYLARGGEPTLN